MNWMSTELYWTLHWLALSFWQGVDGVTVCAALTSQYCMINTDTSHITDLFPIDDNVQPIIKRISKVCYSQLLRILEVRRFQIQFSHELKKK